MSSVVFTSQDISLFMLIQGNKDYKELETNKNLQKHIVKYFNIDNKKLKKYLKSTDIQNKIKNFSKTYKSPTEKQFKVLLQSINDGVNVRGGKRLVRGGDELLQELLEDFYKLLLHDSNRKNISQNTPSVLADYYNLILKNYQDNQKNLNLISIYLDRLKKISSDRSQDLQKFKIYNLDIYIGQLEKLKRESKFEEEKKDYIYYDDDDEISIINKNDIKNNSELSPTTTTTPTTTTPTTISPKSIYLTTTNP